jgi:poly(hydroxyalkanoate) depolymerase family esterase
VSLAKNIEFFRRLPKLPGINSPANFARGVRPDGQSPLGEIVDFGSNPGELRMFSFIPDTLARKADQGAALVVVLHGCGQTAAGYDLGAGWSTLAKQYGFALLMPEQQAANNAHGCFNWFSREDTARDRGEACSIRQMVARMVSDHGIDTRRIFITGLSAGGAMTSVMLATYPDVFAGGAVIAGLPFGIATNVRQALSGMAQSPSRPAGELGDLVRNASEHKGPWPKVSVWHGSADRTVNPANADEIVKQWLDVHDLPQAPMSEGTVDGYPRQVWWNKDGQTIIESYTITNMAHGTPLGLADNDERYGAAGAFMIEAGISSSYHIAQFFGLTERVHASKAAAAESPSSKLIPTVSPVSPPTSDVKKVRRPKETAMRDAASSRSRTIDVSDVITRALTAAGLMK